MYSQLQVASRQLQGDLVVRTKSELLRLAGEIGWYQEQAKKTVMLALQYKLEIGRRLARAKCSCHMANFFPGRMTNSGGRRGTYKDI